MAVRAAFIGYKSTQVEGVKVLADQTITVDVQLEQTAVQIQEITVVTQTQPLVPRDEVTTKQRVDGAFVDKLPVDRIDQVLQLQPGVSADNNGSLSIRGGRNREAATYVDGVPVQAGYRGDRLSGSAATQITVATNAFEEASVTTGSSSAEFGNAKSGIVSIVTKTGGPTTRARSAYESDEPFGVNHSVGLNRLQGSFSGPLAGRLPSPSQWNARGTEGDRRRVQQPGRCRSSSRPASTPRCSRPALCDDPTTPSTSSRPPTPPYVPVYNFAVSRGTCDTFADAGAAGSAADDAYIQQDPEQLRARLQGSPAAGDREDALSGVGQAQLFLRHRFPGRAQLQQAAGMPVTPTQRSPIRYLNNLSLNRILQGFSRRNRWRPSTGPRTWPRAPSGRWHSMSRCRTSRTGRSRGR